MSLEKFTTKLKKCTFKSDLAANAPRFYDIVNSLFNKRSIKGINISPRNIIRAISMDESLLPICAVLSKYAWLDSEFFMELLFAILPKRNKGFGFFKYIKMKDSVDKNVLDPVAKYFHVNKREAKNLLAMLNYLGTTTDDVKSFFGVN